MLGLFKGMDGSLQSLNRLFLGLLLINQDLGLLDVCSDYLLRVLPFLVLENRQNFLYVHKGFRIVLHLEIAVGY